MSEEITNSPVIVEGNSSVPEVSTPVVDTPEVKVETVVEKPWEQVVSKEDFHKSAPFLRKNFNAKNTPDVSVTEEVKTEPEVKVEPEVKTEPTVETESTTTTEPVVDKVKLPTGEELTLEEIVELKKGNMRQADYTKKTQELAEDRKELQRLRELPIKDAIDLWDSLSRDPIGTVRYLEEHYNGLGFTEPKDPEVLRAEKELADEKAKNKQLAEDNDTKQQEETMQLFNTYMDGLAVKYKAQGFDRDKVLEYAMTNNIPDPENAFKAMMFDVIPTKEVELAKTKEELENTKKKAEADVKSAVTDYVKDKVITSANFVAPVGSGNSGSGVSVEKPKTWKAARQAAMSRQW